MKLWFAAALVLIGLQPAAKPGSPLAAGQGGSPLYVATFIDLMPQNAAAGTAAITKYVADSRKDAGAVRVEAIAQNGRENHLVIFEVWQDQSRFDAHESAAHTRSFRATLLPLIGAPFDQRLHHLVQ
jgi:quinol monooxygenase YgiN